MNGQGLPLFLCIQIVLINLPSKIVKIIKKYLIFACSLLYQTTMFQNLFQNIKIKAITFEIIRIIIICTPHRKLPKILNTYFGGFFFLSKLYYIYKR